MSAFQWISTSGLTVVLLWDLRALLRAEGQSLLHLSRICLWLLAIACVLQPDLTSLAARALGIDRGADLVAYAFHFALLGTSLFFYSRYLELRKTLTELVRHLAIREASQGSSKTEEA